MAADAVKLSLLIQVPDTWQWRIIDTARHISDYIIEGHSKKLLFQNG